MWVPLNVSFDLKPTIDIDRTPGEMAYLAQDAYDLFDLSMRNTLADAPEHNKRSRLK